MEPRRLPSDDLIIVDEEESKQVVTIQDRSPYPYLFARDVLSIAIGGIDDPSLLSYSTGGRIEPKPRAE